MLLKNGKITLVLGEIPKYTKYFTKLVCKFSLILLETVLFPIQSQTRMHSSALSFIDNVLKVNISIVNTHIFSCSSGTSIGKSTYFPVKIFPITNTKQCHVCDT